MTENKIVFWHRRDLRIDDNAGLYYALKKGNVYPIFVFDNTILSHLHSDDQRIIFIHQQITQLRKQYRELGGDLEVIYGNPLEVIPAFVAKCKAQEVFTNADYEPAARKRDHAIGKRLKEMGVQLHAVKDQVIFDPMEVLKADGKPYGVFTPYSKVWKARLTEPGGDYFLKSYPVLSYTQHLAKFTTSSLPTLSEMGFSGQQRQTFPPPIVHDTLLREYADKRDMPSVAGTSRLSLHLRFGTISIRKLVAHTRVISAKFTDELIWREFYQMILYHYPHTVTQAFRPEYDRIVWENDPPLFELWCAGKTGYPLVDAGMRELNETGFMHNRVRMVVASFLCKHLLIDWRLGEAYFALKLLDYEQASNVGGWQWAAGSGCDAAPYFRVFNPTLQQERFDPDFDYIRRWVPEFGTSNYPQPIVPHAPARERAIARYQQALKNL